MEPYESEFVLKLRGLVREGPDFAALVRDALLETLGEAGSAVILAGMDRATLEDPVRFARELSRFFGTGAVSVLRIVVIRASEGDKSHPGKGSSGVIENLLVEHEGPDSRLGTQGIRRRNYLHDPRMKDDLEEYRERMVVSDLDLG